MIRARLTSFVLALGLSISCGEYFSAPSTTAADKEKQRGHVGPVEGFTLGMKLREAEHILKTGIAAGTYKLLDVERADGIDPEFRTDRLISAQTVNVPLKCDGIALLSQR